MGYGRQTSDYKEFGAPFVVTYSAYAASGTNAAVTAPVAAQVYRVPFNAKIVGATAYYSTGGTAATGSAPNPLIVVSLAGTGTYTAIGTCAMGTDATAASAAFTVASGTAALLTAGDFVGVAGAIGTSATGKVANIMMSFIEMP